MDIDKIGNEAIKVLCRLVKSGDMDGFVIMSQVCKLAFGEKFNIEVVTEKEEKDENI